MSDRLSVDPAQLRASAENLARQADGAEQMLKTMRAIIAEQGTCWGEDELGEMFAKDYEPDSERGVTGFEDLVEEMRSMSAGLRDSADAFEERDLGNAQQIEEPGRPTGSSADRPMTTRPAIPAQSSGVNGEISPDGNYSRQAATGSPVAGPGVRPELGNSFSDPGSTPQQSPDSTRPQNSPQAESPTPDLAGEPAGNPPSRTTPPVPAATTDIARSPNTAATSPEARRPVTPGPAKGRTPASRPTADSPWSQNRPGTRPTPPPASPPTTKQSPPRVSPPQAPTRPPNHAKPDKPVKRTPKRVESRAAATAPTGAEAMRIAQDMATRFGLSIAGFESAGLETATVQDIADAVGIVLVRYPTLLRGIEISEAASAPAAVEDRGESTTVSPWMILALAAAAARPPADRAGDERGSQPSPGRPMYTTVLRGLGSAFDLLGGFRARREAQRALITEYLRLHGAQGETLGQVVRGYKRWRAQLGDGCFDRGVFAPERALAEAFAEVESRRDAASGPAKVLHRTLVMISRTSADIPDRR